MQPRRTRLSIWKRLAMVVTGLSLIAVFACNSPFIPIPPPNPTFTQDSSGDWTVAAGPDSRAVGATYFIYNASLGSGIIQRAETDGSVYARPLHGQAGDHIFIHWERGVDTSSVICRPLGQGLVQLTCQ